MVIIHIIFFFFFFNDTATTEIYTLSLHDALPIWGTLSAPYARAAAAVFGRASIPTGARDQSRQTDFRHGEVTDRKSTRLNSSHLVISYAVFCLKKKKKQPMSLDRCALGAVLHREV